MAEAQPLGRASDDLPVWIGAGGFSLAACDQLKVRLCTMGARDVETSVAPPFAPPLETSGLGRRLGGGG